MGPQDASIMFVGDYPTADELDAKRACVGGCGKLVENYFHDNGWSLNKVYRTTFIKDKFSWPRGNKARKDAWNRIDWNRWEKMLREEVKEVNPNVILTAGDISTYSVSGRKPVTKLRGSILRPSEKFISENSVRPSIRVVPVIHPRDILGNWIFHYFTKFDYGRAIKYKDRTDVHKEKSLLWICRSLKALEEWWQRARKGKFLTVDIETYMTFITCIGFSHDGYEAISVPFIERSMNNLERGMLIRKVLQILDDPIPKVNQNIRYDDRILTQWGLPMRNIADDTMLLSHTIYPEFPHGLDFLTSIYTEMAYYKDDGRDFNPKDGWDTLFYYNAKDALSTWQVYEEEIKDAKELKVWDFYTTKVWPLFNIYKKLEDRGIKIDPVEQRILETKYDEMLRNRVWYLRKLAGDSKLNFNSPKQIQELIFNKLLYPMAPAFKTNRETGVKGLSTDEETLEELILNYSRSEEMREIAWSVLWCRKLYKILNTYIRCPYHLDGRMRTNVKLTGTKNGRTSNSETIDRLWFENTKWSPFWNPRIPKSHKYSSTELGIPFQTIPKHGFEIGNTTIGKDIRRMYVASPGFTFVEGDGGQAEARVVAVLADDRETLNEMNRKDFKRNRYGLKDDIHTKTAMLVLNKGFDEITEEDRQNFGKKPRHAGNYDMGAARLSLMAHISLLAAQTTLTRFHSGVSKVRECFHTRIRSLVQNTRELRSPHGRLRQFFDKLSDQTYKDAFAFIPQATVSDHIKCNTITPLMQKWDPLGVFFLSESHDSGLFEVPTEMVDDFIPDFKRIEETPILFTQGSFISDLELVIPLEVKKGQNWYEMKEVKGL